MAQKAIIIVGASGHARVCLDILLALGKTVLGFCDDNPALRGSCLNDYPILGEVNEVICSSDKNNIHFFVAIGNNRHRHHLVNLLKKHDIFPTINIIHPSAVISPRVSLGMGNFIAPGVIINTDTIIKNYTIINTGVTIDHDNLVHDFAQVSPGCNLAGNVTVEEFAFLGTGTVVIPQQTIGDHAVIGAGAVVTRDIPPGSTAVGVPARIIKSNQNK
jgi:sugar O-acyltransferase (sialic acid O-acetyltransferase NeuD family)